jgi:hypothetical protein
MGGYLIKFAEHASSKWFSLAVNKTWQKTLFSPIENL